MFHLPVGEMAVTLEDVALLLGLPCVGQVMEAIDVSATWREDLLARFVNVVRNDRVVCHYEGSSTHTNLVRGGCSSSAYTARKSLISTGFPTGTAPTILSARALSTGQLTRY